ncbi:50S ribosomal protein L9 [Patescibacteria group bacterium]|nr:50S ribosomal protein L9 [Patescibacteria group bacterium]
MKVILIADVKKVGQRGSVLTVADGYALNVLIPQKKAILATPENLKKHERSRAATERRSDASRAEAEALLAALDQRTITIPVKSGPTGTLFKALTARDIVAAIKTELGVELAETALVLPSPIKHTGTHEVPVVAGDKRARLVLEIG